MDLSHKNAHGSNVLHLAIKSQNKLICRTIVQKFDKWELKTEVNAENKTALKIVTELVDDGDSSLTFLGEKILEKTGQKQKPYRTPSSHNVVDKRQTQSSCMFRGKSCGYSFKSQALDPSNWICLGDNCAVITVVKDDFYLVDPHHYNRSSTFDVQN